MLQRMNCLASMDHSLRNFKQFATKSGTELGTIKKGYQTTKNDNNNAPYFALFNYRNAQVIIILYNTYYAVIRHLIIIMQ